MNKYYEHLQAAVRFFWLLIGFSRLIGNTVTSLAHRGTIPHRRLDCFF